MGVNQNKWKDTTHIKVVSFSSVGVAGILILLKLFAWWTTHSISLQASLIDSLLDAAASLFNLIAIQHALRPADREHRFGHGKVESIAGLMQAFFIGISSIWLLYEAIQHFFAPQPIEYTGLGLSIMTLTIFMTLLLVSYQSYVVRRTRSMAVSADMLHYRADLLINIAVIVSLLSVQYFNIPLIDPLIGLGIGVYILWTAWKIIMEAINILMDSEIDDKDRDRILTIAKSHPGVLDVQDLKTRSSGLQHFFQMHLIMDPHISLMNAHKIAGEVEEKIISAYPKSQIIVRLKPCFLEKPLKTKHMI